MGAAQESYREKVQCWFPILNFWEVVKWILLCFLTWHSLFFFSRNIRLHSPTVTLCTCTSGASYDHSLIWWALSSPLASQPGFIRPVQELSSGVTCYASCLALLTLKVNVTLQRQSQTIWLQKKSNDLNPCLDKDKKKSISVWFFPCSPWYGTPTSHLFINTASWSNSTLIIIQATQHNSVDYL